MWYYVERRTQSAWLVLQVSLEDLLLVLWVHSRLIRSRVWTRGKNWFRKRQTTFLLALLLMELPQSLFCSLHKSHRQVSPEASVLEPKKERRNNKCENWWPRFAIFKAKFSIYSDLPETISGTRLCRWFCGKVFQEEKLWINSSLAQKMHFCSIELLILEVGNFQSGRAGMEDRNWHWYRLDWHPSIL